MNIETLLSNTGDTTYYDEAFLNIIDSHIPYLKTLSSTVIQPLDPNLVYRHEGDLTGLLDEMHYPKYHHYAIMRINGFRSTNELTLDITTLIIPDTAEIDLLHSIYKTQKFTL